ncbi:MAG: hypothetical protein CMM01_18230 [Rhodopirellula sp.]|nr:hypothetical protein [Rhodopirellula sp.]OUX49967.1 MAG: hypothetical protein CBE43_08425 [Rhodopirellula sp. TMED283]
MPVKCPLPSLVRGLEWTGTEKLSLRTLDFSTAKQKTVTQSITPLRADPKSISENSSWIPALVANRKENKFTIWQVPVPTGPCNRTLASLEAKGSGWMLPETITCSETLQASNHRFTFNTGSMMTSSSITHQGAR